MNLNLRNPDLDSVLYYEYLSTPISQTIANGTSTEYAYGSSDPRYFVNSITHKYGSTTLAAIGYPSRDDAGNPLSMSDWTGSWTYSYDANNRLTAAMPPNPVPDQPAGGPYGYDWIGNRQHPPVDPNPMVYNNADQLITWPGMHTYTYYPDGSLQYMKDAAGTSVTGSYTYTPDGLLSSASLGNKTLAHTWDADNNRVVMNANGATYTSIYDVTAGIPTVIDENASDGATYYIHEPDGRLLARLHGTTWHYYLFDDLGSTRMLTDIGGSITDRYAYDAYGALISHDRYAGSVEQPYQYVGRLGYYTHWQEPDFGLLHLGVRFYDPQTGGFTQVDPERNEMSAYMYTDGIPTASVDPSGAAPPPLNDFSGSWLSCIDKAIGRLPFKKPTGVGNACRGLSNRQCWAKVARCITRGESVDNPQAKNTQGSSATGLMQILDCHQDSCGSYLRKLGVLKEGETFNRLDPNQNLTCGVYLLYSCAKNGSVPACKSSRTYKAIGNGNYKDCMKNWWPPKERK